MVDDQNMYRKQHCADHHQEISFPDGEGIGDAKQIQSRQSQRHSRPDGSGTFLFQKDQSQDGDDYDVAGGDKTGPTHGGILDSDLLEAAGRGQEDSAPDASRDQCFAGTGGLPGSSLLLFRGIDAVQQKNTGDQYDSADEAAHRVEGEGLHIIHSHALRHEGGSPDGGGQKQENGIPQFCFLHEYPLSRQTSDLPYFYEQVSRRRPEWLRRDVYQ